MMSLIVPCSSLWRWLCAAQPASLKACITSEQQGVQPKSTISHWSAIPILCRLTLKRMWRTNAGFLGCVCGVGGTYLLLLQTSCSWNNCMWYAGIAVHVKQLVSYFFLDNDNSTNLSYVYCSWSGEGEGQGNLAARKLAGPSWAPRLWSRT